MTNQTIDGLPRELLESFAAYVADSPNAVMRSRAAQLRALLDSPALELIEPVAPWFYFVECDDPDYSGLFNHESEAQTQANDHGGSVVKLWNVPPTYKPAAQPQGEPVAYADPQAFDNFKNLAWRGGSYAKEWMWAKPAPGLIPLYAEQPAPVAVVLPKRREPTQDNPYFSDADHEWNAYRDELKRLNPSL